jgi:hypothetical protein
MTYAIAYVSIVVCITFIMVRMARQAPSLPRAYWCIAIVTGYCILAIVLWLQVLALLNMREPLWIMALILLLIVAVIVGVIPPANSGSQSRKLWSTAARVRRTYRQVIGVVE